ncbi:hypothetical protein [Sinisalibacter aestuarii]|nr:hypothetical protein [Sinisalibacter aestuarii]
MNDKDKQTPRQEPHSNAPEGYRRNGKVDLDQYGYFRIGLDNEKMTVVKPADQTRPVRRRNRERDDGYER